MVILFALAIPMALMVNVCSAGTAVSVNKVWAGVNPADEGGKVQFGSTVYVFTGPVPRHLSKATPLTSP